MKKKFLFSLIALLVSTMTTWAETSCGENATWSYNSGTKTLTISGTGAMSDYGGGTSRPWLGLVGNVTSVVVGEGITHIGNLAFSGCNSLTSVSIASTVTSIGNYAFQNCSALTSITIPNGVTTIGKYAFSKCYTLNYMIVPSAVTSVGEYAFNQCYALQAVVFKSGSLTTYGESAFEDCPDDLKIFVPSSASSVYTTGWSGYSSMIEEGTLGSCGTNVYYVLTTSNDKLTIFGAGAMSDYTESNMPWNDNKTSITSIVIGKNVTTIGNYAFSGCTAIESVTIPEKVTSIGDYAFNDCTKLYAVVCQPTTPPTLGTYAFTGCSSDPKLNIYVPDASLTTYSNATNWKDYSSNFVSLTNLNHGSCGTNVSWTYNSADNSLTINGTGEMYDYANAGNIPWYSYRGNITSIVINDGVTHIGNYAFTSCNNASLTSVTIPASVTSIGFSAFNAANKLTSITLNEGLTTIGTDAFSNCSSLTSITIPASVITIEQGAFFYCTGLNTVSFASGSALTTIGSQAFEKCTSLNSIELPSGLTTISPAAFYNCTGLNSITIPSTVTTIGDQAFYNCTFATVTMNSAYNAGYTSGAFSDCAHVKVPAVHLYTYAQNWTSLNEASKLIGYLDKTTQSGGKYWATYYNDNTAVTVDANTTSYYVIWDDAKIKLKEISTGEFIYKGAPRLLSSTNSEITMTVSSESSGEDYTGNILHGSDTGVEAESGHTYYALANKTKGLGFYKVKSGVTIPAGKAYMRFTSSGSASAREYFLFDEEVTTIDQVERQETSDAVYYDLQGRRVNQPTKGFYIVKGKKVIIK